MIGFLNGPTIAGKEFFKRYEDKWSVDGNIIINPLGIEWMATVIKNGGYPNKYWFIHDDTMILLPGWDIITECRQLLWEANKEGKRILDGETGRELEITYTNIYFEFKEKHL